MLRKNRPTSDMLEDVVIENNNKDTLALGELKNSLHERGFGILMAIAALPLCFPIPVPPGYTTLFSVPLFILSVQMMWGMDSPWLPEWLMRMQVRRKTLAAIIEKANPYLRKIEKLLQPRFSFASSRTGEKIIGIMAFIFSVSIAIPLPLTNFLPGIGILLMSLGLLSRDGFVVIIGIVVGWVGIFLTTLVIVLGHKAVVAILSSFGVNVEVQ